MTRCEACACLEAVVQFTCCFDEGDADGAARWFAPQGVWLRREGDVTGPQALRELIRSRAHLLTRHVLSNPRVRLLQPGHAVVDSYVTAYRATGAERPARLERPFLVGRYRDDLSWLQGGWRIARRELKVDFLDA